MFTYFAFPYSNYFNSIIVTLSFSTKADDCPDGWMRYLDNCIIKLDNNSNSAKYIDYLCGNLSASPIKIQSARKLSFVKLYLEESPKPYYYLGLKKISWTKDYFVDFKWRDDTPLYFHNFDSIENLQSSSEIYVAIESSSGMWRDFINFFGSSGYICEKTIGYF